MPSSSSSSRQAQGQQHQQERRTFRGRGGPNDRRLPKHDASGRKRRTVRQQDQELEHQQEQQPQHQQEQHDEESQDHSIDPSLDSVGHNETSEQNARHVSTSHHLETFDLRNDAEDTVVVTSTKDMEERIVEETREKCQQEISHLLKRAQNVQESIQLSTAIGDPQIWQTNVLLAVKNCVHEWHSIVHHYSPSGGSGIGGEINVDADDDDVTEVEGNVDDDNSQVRDAGTSTLAVQLDHVSQTDLHSYLVLPEDQRLKVGTTVFLLIQLALQSGPLRGSQPGYFKRCGSDVARTALEFLQSLPINLATSAHPSVPNDGMCTRLVPEATVDGSQIDALLGFTGKQSTQICKWEKAAAAAVEKNKPPSKSALKQMKKGKGGSAK